jgi:hypothetical protein
MGLEERVFGCVGGTHADAVQEDEEDSGHDGWGEPPLAAGPNPIQNIVSQPLTAALGWNSPSP